MVANTRLKNEVTEDEKYHTPIRLSLGDGGGLRFDCGALWNLFSVVFAVKLYIKIKLNSFITSRTSLNVNVDFFQTSSYSYANSSSQQ